MLEIIIKVNVLSFSHFGSSGQERLERHFQIAKREVKCFRIFIISLKHSLIPFIIKTIASGVFVSFLFAPKP